jgi:dolichol-phosphate mannosyltransferase
MDEVGAAPIATAIERTGRLRAPELTIVVPTFCEHGNVERLIKRIDDVLRDVHWEIVFVDDDSPDGTAALVKSIGETDARVRCIRRVKRRGLAGACIEGMLSSQARFIAVIDGDLQHDERLLTRMLLCLRFGEADVAIGSRFEAAEIPGLSPARFSISSFATRVAVGLLGVRVSDPLSGFFMIRRSVVDEIAPRLSTHGFKILLDILASKRLRIAEFPYIFQSRDSGASKLDSRVVLDFAGLLLAKVTGDIVPIRFLSFALVGVVGILVHLVTLKILLAYAELGFGWAQTLATIVAMTSNFFLNNAMTYSSERLTGMRALAGLFIFFAICSVGAVSNISVASWLYGNQSGWWLSGLLGSMVSAVWNYAVSSTLVWTALSKRS